VPILLITGWGVELNREELAAHGVDAMLSKPLDTTSNYAVVTSVPGPGALLILCAGLLVCGWARSRRDLTS
jgi:hypothetical protein